MDEKNKNIETTQPMEEKYDINYARKRVNFILIHILLMITSLVLFIVCMVGANSEPFIEYGGEAGQAILLFVSLIFLGFLFISFLCLVIPRKNISSYATKKDNKFNIVNAQAQTNQAESQHVEVMVKKSKHNVSSLDELYDYFTQYMAAKGYKSESLPPLLASMLYSRLLIVRTADEDFLDVYANFFGHNATIIKFDEDGGEQTILEHSKFINLCGQATNDPDVPFFIVIDNAKLKWMKEFLSPIYKGIKSPTEKCRFTSKGDEILLPKNIVFILKINEGEQLFDADKDLLDYACYLELTLEKGEEGDSCLPVNLTYMTLMSLLKDAKQNYSISDDAWKRVDAVIDASCENTDFVINNKSYLKIENFCFSLYIFQKDDYKAIDETLANVVLISILSHWTNESVVANTNIERLFNNNLGGKAPKTMMRISQFLKLFDKEGNRL